MSACVYVGGAYYTEAILPRGQSRPCVYAQLQQKTKEFCFFSLALAESTDVQDTAQLLIFIRGVNANFEMCEELAALQSLKGTTTGEDILGKVGQTMEQLDLDWSKLASITTDGAPWWARLGV